MWPSEIWRGIFSRHIKGAENFEIIIKKKKKNYSQRTMVEANPTPTTTPVPNKKTVMVLGSLGTGKSCVMNRLSLSGANSEEVKEEPFPSVM